MPRPWPPHPGPLHQVLRGGRRKKSFARRRPPLQVARSPPRPLHRTVAAAEPTVEIVSTPAWVGWPSVWEGDNEHRPREDGHLSARPPRRGGRRRKREAPASRSGQQRRGPRERWPLLLPPTSRGAVPPPLYSPRGASLLGLLSLRPSVRRGKETGGTHYNRWKVTCTVEGVTYTVSGLGGGFGFTLKCDSCTALALREQTRL